MQIIFYRKGEREAPTTTKDIPDRFLPLLLPYANCVWTPGSYGGHITQQIAGDHYTLTLYDFFIESAVKLYPFATAPLVTFVFVMEGTLSCLLQGFGALSLQETCNYLFYVPTGIRHEAYLLPGSYRLLHFSLSPPLLSELAKDYPVIRTLINKLDTSEVNGTKELEVPFTLRTWGLLHDVLHYRPSRGHLHTFIQSKIFELMLEYTKALEQPEKISRAFNAEMKSVADRLLQVKVLIDEHEGKPFRIEFLARKSALNSKQLKEAFHKMFQTTIGKYQLQQRMIRAGELLVETSLSVDEISEKVGYDDRSSFTRKFKTLYKVTPLRYRGNFRK
ncbi:MAG: AraC family transcriptional regulator [Flavitalea sp.]